MITRGVGSHYYGITWTRRQIVYELHNMFPSRKLATLSFYSLIYDNVAAMFALILTPQTWLLNLSNLRKIGGTWQGRSKYKKNKRLAEKLTIKNGVAKNLNENLKSTIFSLHLNSSRDTMVK